MLAQQYCMKLIFGKCANNKACKFSHCCPFCASPHPEGAGAKACFEQHLRSQGFLLQHSGGKGQPRGSRADDRWRGNANGGSRRARSRSPRSEETVEGGRRQRRGLAGPAPLQVVIWRAGRDRGPGQWSLWPLPCRDRVGTRLRAICCHGRRKTQACSQMGSVLLS